VSRIGSLATNLVEIDVDTYVRNEVSPIEASRGPMKRVDGKSSTTKRGSVKVLSSSYYLGLRDSLATYGKPTKAALDERPRVQLGDTGSPFP
jgi:hypothetical protein